MYHNCICEWVLGKLPPPPALILTLILNQTLALTGRQFSGYPVSVMNGESMKTRIRKRKHWVRDYFRETDQYGPYKLTLEELRLNDPFFISTISKNEYTRLWGVYFLFCYFTIQDYPMWTHAQILLKDFDCICTKVIFRSIYFNRELPVVSSEACFFF